MNTIQMNSWLCRDKELRSIGIGSFVCAGEEVQFVVWNFKGFIIEVSAVDALSSDTVAMGYVSTLYHKVWYCIKQRGK